MFISQKSVVLGSGLLSVADGTILILQAGNHPSLSPMSSRLGPLKANYSKKFSVLVIEYISFSV